MKKCLLAGINRTNLAMINHIWQCEVCETIHTNKLRSMTYVGDEGDCVHAFALDQPLVCGLCGHKAMRACISCRGATYNLQPYLVVLPTEPPPSPSAHRPQISANSGIRTQILPHGGE